MHVLNTPSENLRIFVFVHITSIYMIVILIK